MVVLVDGTADRTQRVVAVGQDIRDREFLHAGCFGCLDNADKRDVMRSHGVKLNFQLVHVAGGVVRGEDGIGNRALLCFLLVCRLSGQCLYLRCILLCDNFLAADQIYAAVI